MTWSCFDGISTSLFPPHRNACGLQFQRILCFVYSANVRAVFSVIPFFFPFHYGSMFPAIPCFSSGFQFLILSSTWNSTILNICSSQLSYSKFSGRNVFSRLNLIIAFRKSSSTIRLRPLGLFFPPENHLLISFVVFL